jgi:hypothetical protein
MIFTAGAVGWQRACGLALPVSPDGTKRRPFSLRRIARRQGRRFLLARFLGIFALCLAVGFIAYIVLEAFDLDPDLWPFGTENFNVAFQAQPLTDGQAAGAFAALSALQRFVKTAGAHLVCRHRARSDIAALRPSIFIAFTVAERWWSYVMVTPVLGHPVSWVRSMAASSADERERQT